MKTKTKTKKVELDKYRFETGSLYELQGDAYVHVFIDHRCKTKQAAIKAYEETE